MGLTGLRCPPDPLGVDAATLTNAFSTLMREVVYLHKKEERRQRPTLTTLYRICPHTPREGGEHR